MNIVLKTKIRINGREYGSVEQIPPELREAYERAMRNVAPPAAGGDQFNASASIVFNGRQYGSVEEMPSDVRALYGSVMAMVDPDGNSPPGSPTPGREAAAVDTRVDPRMSQHMDLRGTLSVRTGLITRSRLTILLLLLAGLLTSWAVVKALMVR